MVLLIGKSLRRKNMGNGKRVKRKKAEEKMLEEDFMMQNLQEPRIEQKRNCKMIKISDKRLQGCNADQQVLMHQALVEDDKNHTEKTILLLKRVIDIQPTVPYAFALLGSIYLDQAKLLDATYHYDKRKRKYITKRIDLYKNAIYYFEKALVLKPDWPGVVLLLARACEQCSFLKKALKYYDLYLTVRPNNAEAYYAKGMIYEYKKEYQTAIDLYQKALLFDPDNESYRNRIMKLQKNKKNITKSNFGF